MKVFFTVFCLIAITATFLADVSGLATDSMKATVNNSPNVTPLINKLGTKKVGESCSCEDVGHFCTYFSSVNPYPMILLLKYSIHLLCFILNPFLRT